MPTPNRLKALAAHKGVPVSALIQSAVSEAGSVKGAAAQLGVARWTITRWLRLNGYTLQTQRLSQIIQSDDAIQVQE